MMRPSAHVILATYVAAALIGCSSRAQQTEPAVRNQNTQTAELQKRTQAAPGAGQDPWKRVICESLPATAASPQGSSLTLGVGVSPEPKGLVVQRVVDCGAADLAGVKTGDVIRQINGQAVATVDDIRSIVKTAGQGAAIALSVERNGEPLTLQALLPGGPSKPQQNSSPTQYDANENADSDVLIVPGERIGPISLGTWSGNVLAKMPDANDLDTESNRGTLVEVHASSKLLGLEVAFSGPPSGGSVKEGAGAVASFLFTANAVWVAVSPDDGPASSKYRTARGIQLGSSQQDVIRAYGPPEKQATFDDGVISLQYDSMGIDFDLTKGTVTIGEIRVYKPEKSQ